ncbi:MAG: hypothetical protein LW625_03615 [Planctomycetaceae bacterium]|nr:hypothetical protein [Planctomycetaceae bacterium]
MILHGVDFSGADSGGAAKIRMVSRDLQSPGTPIRLEGRFDRKGLVRRILSLQQDGRQHMVRIDAPFGLPLETLRCFEVQPSWLAMADWMVAFGSPRLWRGAIRQTVRKEPRRLCDEQFRTPMAPMNLRVFKQTWTLIAEVLKPLGMKGWPDHGYKGQGEPPRAVRADLMRLMYRERIVVTPDMEAAAIDDVEGDLLDALLLTLDPLQWVPPSEARVEAWIY